MAKSKNDNNHWVPLGWLSLIAGVFLYGLYNGASVGKAFVIGLEWFGVVFVAALAGIYIYQNLFTKSGWKNINEDIERRELRKQEKRARRRAKYGSMMRRATKGFMFGIGFGAADGIFDHDDNNGNIDS